MKHFAVKKRPETKLKHMDFGLHLPASSPTVKAEDLVRFARKAEELGFYCLTVADHVIVPREISVPYPYTVDGKYPGAGYHLETLTTMGFLAGATQRIRFVTSVMILPYRNPIVTAKMLASLDVLSGGRVIVGAGVGWMKEEFETIRTEPFAERGKVTDEYIAAFRELWSSDNPSFTGKYCSFSDIVFQPKVAAEKARVEKRRAHAHIALGQMNALGDAATRMAGFHTGIPQRVLHALGQCLDQRRDLPGK